MNVNRYNYVMQFGDAIGPIVEEIQQFYFVQGLTAIGYVSVGSHDVGGGSVVDGALAVEPGHVWSEGGDRVLMQDQPLGVREPVLARGGDDLSHSVRIHQAGRAATEENGVQNSATRRS